MERLRVYGVLLGGAHQGAPTRHRLLLGRRGRSYSRGLLPGPRRPELRHPQVAVGRSVCRPDLDGNCLGGHTRGPGVRPGDPRPVSGQDAGLQPVAVVQLGFDRYERRRDAGVPEAAGRGRLRVQFHHLRWPPDRRCCSRGVRNGSTRRRHARAGSNPTQDPPARVALPYAADPCRRPSSRRRIGGLVGAHCDDQSHGQGIHAGSAPCADRAPQEDARGLARRLEGGLRHRRAPGGTAAAESRRC